MFRRHDECRLDVSIDISRAHQIICRGFLIGGNYLFVTVVLRFHVAVVAVVVVFHVGVVTDDGSSLVVVLVAFVVRVVVVVACGGELKLK